MTRKFEPRRGCWKLVEIIDVSSTDKVSKDVVGFPVFGTSETKMNCGGVEHGISKDPENTIRRSRFHSTRWSVSHTLPVLFSFLVPPEPPEVVDPDGGASGMARLSSAPSISLIIISKGRGTGIRPSSIIVQLRAIVGGMLLSCGLFVSRSSWVVSPVQPENPECGLRALSG